MFLKNTSFFCCFPKPSKFHNLTVSELQKTFIWEGGTIQAGLWFAIYNTQTNKVLPSQKTLKNFVSWRSSSGRETWSRAYVCYLRYLNKKSLPCQKKLWQIVYPREALLGGRHDHHDHVIAIYEAAKKLNCDNFWIWEKLILEGGRRSRPRLRLWPARLPGDNPHAHSSAARDVFPRTIRVFVSVQNVNFLVLRLYVIVCLYLSNACIVFVFMHKYISWFDFIRIYLL